MIRPLDIQKLKHDFETAEPFPFIMMDGFLEDGFAREIVEAFPTFDQAGDFGYEFSTVNEHRKIQATDSSMFPEPIARLNAALADQSFLDALSEITGIPKLQADPKLEGGGLHLTASSGLLDVHVDFNLLPERRWYRRLNILLYLNPEWQSEWGGQLELWDRDVGRCYHTVEPLMNRCVVFQTSEFSYHGVVQVKCPEGKARQSFAGYYYTEEPQDDYAGHDHSTIFRARPDEKMKGVVYMPAEKVTKLARRGARRIKKLIGK